MLLKPIANPYENGHLTRSVLYRPNETQTYAIDAEQLHRNPRLLNAFGRGRALLIRALDVTAYLLGLGGVAASFFFAWWLFVPSLLASTAMLLANRKAAGTMARKAIAESNAHFFYLHSQRALWLVPQPGKKVVMTGNKVA